MHNQSALPPVGTGMRMVRFTRRDNVISAFVLGFVGLLLIAAALSALWYEPDGTCDDKPMGPADQCLTYDGTYTRGELIERRENARPKVALVFLGFSAVFLAGTALAAHEAGLWRALGGLLSGRTKAVRARGARMRTTTAIVGAVDEEGGVPLFLILGRYTTGGEFRPVGQVIVPFEGLAGHLAGWLCTAGADHPWPCSPGFFDAIYGGSGIPVNCRRVVPRLVVEVRVEPGRTEGAWGHIELLRCRPDLSIQQVPRGTLLGPRRP